MILFFTGVFWIDYDSLCRFFDVIYINWNPELFKYTTCTHRLDSSLSHVHPLVRFFVKYGDWMNSVVRFTWVDEKRRGEIGLGI